MAGEIEEIRKQLEEMDSRLQGVERDYQERLNDVWIDLYGGGRRDDAGIIRELRQIREDELSEIRKKCDSIERRIGKIYWVGIGFATAFTLLGGMFAAALSLVGGS